MALFPKIQSPCPYKNNLAAVMDGDMCRICKRQVVDLTAMTDGERVAFLAACTGEVCVSYRLRPVLAAAVVAAAMAIPASAAAEVETIVIEAGGIKDLSAVEYIETASDRAIPKLPVIYDDTAPQQVQAGAPTVTSSPAGS